MPHFTNVFVIFTYESDDLLMMDTDSGGVHYIILDIMWLRSLSQYSLFIFQNYFPPCVLGKDEKQGNSLIKRSEYTRKSGENKETRTARGRE